MTTMMLKIEEFVKRNGMSETEKREMLEILNESLLEISNGIMRESKVKEKEKEKEKEKNKVSESKRYKSKKAEEYAEEHGLRLEDFEKDDISKKDVETKVREMTKEKVIRKIEETSSSKKNKSEIKREKIICSGINKKGEACKSVGTIKPEGAKKKYCFRHAEDFKSFECNSDSSDNEEEEECNQCEKEISEKENSEKENSEDELEEEEYN